MSFLASQKSLCLSSKFFLCPKELTTPWGFVEHLNNGCVSVGRDSCPMVHVSVCCQPLPQAKYKYAKNWMEVITVLIDYLQLMSIRQTLKL